MIEEGVKKSTYKKTKDATLQDLKKFQDFLCRKLYTYKHYQSMYPHSNQPAKSCRTAKGRKSNHIQEINREKLKFCPIMDQTRTQLQYITSNLTVLKTTLQKQVYNK